MRDVEKSKIANRPKRVLPKFRVNSSHVRSVRGRLGGIREAQKIRRHPFEDVQACEITRAKIHPGSRLSFAYKLPPLHRPQLNFQKLFESASVLATTSA